MKTEAQRIKDLAPQDYSPIVYVVPEHFYNMAKSLGWDMSKFEIARGLPDETIINTLKENIMNRQPGYYHVKYHDEFIVAKYSDFSKGWHILSDDAVSYEHENILQDSDFQVINETRIPSPDEEIIIHDLTPPNFFKEQEDEIRNNTDWDKYNNPRKEIMMPESRRFEFPTEAQLSSIAKAALQLIQDTFPDILEGSEVQLNAALVEMGIATKYSTNGREQ